jgi:hypothetical protein
MPCFKNLRKLTIYPAKDNDVITMSLKTNNFSGFSISLSEPEDNEIQQSGGLG